MLKQTQFQHGTELLDSGFAISSTESPAVLSGQLREMELWKLRDLLPRK